MNLADLREKNLNAALNGDVNSQELFNKDFGEYGECADEKYLDGRDRARAMNAT